MTDRNLDLANEMERLLSETSAGPWIAEGVEKVGVNWLIAYCGVDADNKAEWIVTTDSVPASEATSNPKADAEFVAFVKSNGRAIVDALRGQALERAPVSGWATRADHEYLKGRTRP